jgi:hypothetical protein
MRKMNIEVYLKLNTIAEVWNMAPVVSLPASVLDTLLPLHYAKID